jgi:hypothetical protein
VLWIIFIKENVDENMKKARRSAYALYYIPYLETNV